MYHLFSCDAWHTHTSKDLMSSHRTQSAAIKAAKRDCKENDYVELSADDLHNLEHQHQTQGREVNYIITTNTIRP